MVAEDSGTADVRSWNLDMVPHRPGRHFPLMVRVTPRRRRRAVSTPDDGEGRYHDGGHQPGGVGAGIHGAGQLGDEAGQDGGQAQAEVGGGEEEGHDRGPVTGLGEPVDLTPAAAEDEPHGDPADNSAGQEQPQRPGEQRRFQHGQAAEQQRQAGGHTPAGWQPRGHRLADRGDDEDQEGRRADQGQVLHGEDSVQEGGYQAAERPEDAEGGEHAEAGPGHHGPLAGRDAQAVTVPVGNPAARPLTIRATMSSPMPGAARNSPVLTAAHTTAIASPFLRPIWSLRSPKATSANSVPTT